MINVPPILLFTPATTKTPTANRQKSPEIQRFPRIPSGKIAKKSQKTAEKNSRFT